MEFCYFPVLSLKEMALRRVAVVLVNNPDILGPAEKFPFKNSTNYYQSEWMKTVSSKITDAASKLLLPASLTSEIIPILKAVSSEVLRWGIFHQQFYSRFDRDLSVILAEKLCWTTAGAVDYRKTSEMLVRSAVLDGVQRFELACFYCLEDYTPILWQELSEEDKRIFYYNNEIPLEVDAPSLQFLLPYILEKHRLNSTFSLPAVRRDPMRYAAKCGNKAATEYCLRKLPKVNRESSLFETAKNILLCYHHASTRMTVGSEQLADVLRYLLSLMTPEEQLRVFKRFPCEVLECFLAWPSHDLFLDIADVIWTFLSEKEYWSLLDRIADRMARSGYYLPNIVREFFLRSPRNFRKVFADHWYIIFFRHFLHAEDSQTMQVVFRSLDDADRVKLFFCAGALSFFDECLLWEEGRWHLVEVWIRGASLSNEDRGRLREAFAEFVQRADGGIEYGWRRQKRKRFFEFLDEMDASTANKRSAEDETVTRVKKVCNDQNGTLPRN